MPGSLPILVGLATALASATASACSCYPLHVLLRGDGARLASLVQGADFVAHGRIQKVLDADAAELMVLQAFKPAPEVLTLRRRGGNGATCGREPFAVGEEGVFFVHQGTVGLCGRYEAQPRLLEQLRKLKP